MSDQVPQTSFKIPHGVIVKAPGLLPMQYTAHEIAEELNIPESTLRDWFYHGAPHSRDERNHIWVNGERFAAWVEAVRLAKHRNRHSLKDGEAYCLHCNQVVLMLNPVLRHIKGKLYLTKGQCPRCGCIINRGGRYGRSAELPQS